MENRHDDDDHDHDHGHDDHDDEEEDDDDDDDDDDDGRTIVSGIFYVHMNLMKTESQTLTCLIGGSGLQVLALWRKRRRKPMFWVCWNFASVKCGSWSSLWESLLLGLKHWGAIGWRCHC